MKPYQAVGYTMINTSAITAIVGSGVNARIYHGLRPSGTDVPCINYYELPATQLPGATSQPFSINCRAATAGAARDLAKEVLDLWSGTTRTGIYGTMNGFDIGRASIRTDQGLIPEEETGVFNAPVDITVVYAVDTVS